jgi:hypothetical protein
MKTMISHQIRNTILGSLALAGALGTLPVSASEAPKNKIQEWIHTCPYIGLVAKEISYGPITLKDLDLDHNGRVVIAKPNEELNGTIKYKVDSGDLDTLKVHHIIVGIKDQDAQTCIAHAFGIADKEGKTHFTLIAPAKKGVYEIRFDYQTALTCGEAAKCWREDPPSSKAAVGIIIVE